MSSLNKISLNGTIYDIGGTTDYHYVSDNSSSNPFIIEDKEPGIYEFNTSSPYIKLTASHADYWRNTINDAKIIIINKCTSTTPDNTIAFRYLNSEHGTYNEIGVYRSGSSGLSNFGQLSGTSTIVYATGNQTITGTKSFSAIPQCAVTPSSNNDLVNKKYVDDMDSGFIGSPNVYAIEVVTAYPATEEPGHLYIKV